MLRGIVHDTLVDQDIHISERPTPSMSTASHAWYEAATEQSQKLVERGRVLRLDPDQIDPERSERCFFLARELLNLADILKLVPGVSPESSATIRSTCIDRIIKISEEARDYLYPKTKQYLTACHQQQRKLVQKKRALLTPTF